eukprot:TRINITY_DN38192_c0_g1_i1.p1 TRINITY_DN38192_c0_g1~~TRINITY_DN38192_c0_g1_i1.p1  ORF type:complete len:660 (+),score=155.24 TRINITY_DN38192_c0_g1_i1:64-2043(+)
MPAVCIKRVPPLPQTERGQFCVLTADAPGERILYCNGSNVLWRSLASLTEGKGQEKVEEVFHWRGHAKRVTCAAMSPNKEWVVSGDVGGAIRVWGAKGENIQKNEFKLWDGAVKDVAFSEDSTRIVAAGDGKEVRAVALLRDTGSKTGEVGGHSKAINSVAFRNQRPFRVMTGGEDMLVAFHEGPPFKFGRSHTLHTNFVNCVRYSPDGEWAVSAGSDSTLNLYEGKTGEFVKEFAKPEGITGSLWAVAWSPDSKFLATAGGDKTLRIWDREAGAQVNVAKVGLQALEDMQVGLTWTKGGNIVSVSLDGRLMIWNVGADGVAALASVVEGTQGPLSTLARDGKTGTFLQGGSDGVVALTPAEGPVKQTKIGKGIQHILTHSASYAGAPEAWVISLDNCARRLELDTGNIVGAPPPGTAPAKGGYGGGGADKAGAVDLKEFATGAAWLDAAESKVVVVSSKRNVHSVSAAGVEWTKEAFVDRQPTAVATLPGKWLAVAIDKPDSTVGGVASQKFDIHLFDISGASSPDGIVAGPVLEGHLGEVCSMKFSPTGDHLVSADALNKILLWSLKGAAPEKVSADFSRHTARVTTLDWLGPRKFVSGSLDMKVTVHDIDNTSVSGAKVADLEQSHKGGVTAVAACGEDAFASVGHDGFLLVHKLA